MKHYIRINVDEPIKDNLSKFSFLLSHLDFALINKYY